MNFRQELERRKEEAEAEILSFLPDDDGPVKKLAETMQYNMEAPGKRLRPVMMQAAFEMAGGKDRSIVPMMAAMEMIHTHSLIHDDLPALDNDDYRRGRQTTHVIYGEALAILCGDALLNYAYETALRSFQTSVDPTPVIYSLQILTNKTGIHGMLGGQSVDVMNEGNQIGAGILDFIYENKTAALLEASLMIGAAMANAGDEVVKQMETAGHYLGIAFQIRDDILDEIGTQEEIGKPIHSDKKNAKITYLTLHGREAAEQRVEDLSQKAKKIFSSCGSEFLVALTDYLIDRKK